jgi:hypothetical protein
MTYKDTFFMIDLPAPYSPVEEMEEMLLDLEETHKRGYQGTPSLLDAIERLKEMIAERKTHGI